MTNLLTKIQSEKRTPAKLFDLIQIKHGFAFKGEHFGDRGSHVVVTPGNFFEEGGFRRRESKDKWYSGSIPKDYILKKDDLVIAMTEQGEGLLGSSALIPAEDLFLHNQRIGLVSVRNNQAIDKVYLYYLFNSRGLRNHIKASSSGTKVRHTSPDRIYAYEHNFPFLETQKKIAEILTAYDAKISNNKLVIEKLDLMMQTISDEWFVNFHFPGYKDSKFVETELGKIPKDWKILPLDEVANFLNGIASQKFPQIVGEPSLPVIKIREINSGIDEDTERANTNLDKKYIIENGDVLFSWSGSLELITWSGGSGVLNQHIFKVTSELFPKWFYFYCIKKHLQHFRTVASGKATTMGHIQRHHLTETMVVAPDENTFKKTDPLMSGLFDESLRLKLENFALSKSRDQLLAKLI